MLPSYYIAGPITIREHPPAPGRREDIDRCGVGRFENDGTAASVKDEDAVRSAPSHPHQRDGLEVAVDDLVEAGEGRLALLGDGVDLPLGTPQRLLPTVGHQAQPLQVPQDGIDGAGVHDDGVGRERTDPLDDVVPGDGLVRRADDVEDHGGGEASLHLLLDVAAEPLGPGGDLHRTAPCCVVNIALYCVTI